MTDIIELTGVGRASVVVEADDRLWRVRERSGDKNRITYSVNGASVFRSFVDAVFVLESIGCIVTGSTAEWAEPINLDWKPVFRDSHDTFVYDAFAMGESRGPRYVVRRDYNSVGITWIVKIDDFTIATETESKNAMDRACRYEAYRRLGFAQISSTACPGVDGSSWCTGIRGHAGPCTVNQPVRGHPATSNDLPYHALTYSGGSRVVGPGMPMHGAELIDADHAAAVGIADLLNRAYDAGRIEATGPSADAIRDMHFQLIALRDKMRAAMGPRVECVASVEAAVADLATRIERAGR